MKHKLKWENIEGNKDWEEKKRKNCMKRTASKYAVMTNKETG
jgi:hypothetical protein